MPSDAKIAVRVDFPLVLEDEGGRRVRIQPSDRGVYLQIPASVYRRSAWMGEFERHLVRVRQFGATFWRDEVWAAEQRARQALGFTYTDTTGAVVVGKPEPKRGGCGCSGKAR